MGPLAGIKIVELTGIGPGPMCAMLLADLGATVLRIDRADAERSRRATRPLRYDLLLRGRRCLALDLKAAGGARSGAAADRKRRRADRRLSPGRDGAPRSGNRLLQGPECAPGVRPHYRCSGGPLAQAAGHDINYIALTGALHAMGRARTAASAAAEPGGRLWRRRDAAGVRLAAGARARVGPGPGGRRGDDRRRGR